MLQVSKKAIPQSFHKDWGNEKIFIFTTKICLFFKNKKII